MNARNLTLCTWSGIVASVILGIGLYPLMQFVPPPLPSASAAEIAAQYRDNAFGILFGGTLMLAASAFYAPFYAAISSEIERIEGKGSVLAKAQALLGILSVCVPVAVTADLWMVAAFRPDRSDETIQLLNDIGWFLFFTPVVPGLLVSLAIAAAAFADPSPRPTFPRWAAYVCIWVGVLYLPGAMLAFFKSGPFAWNGIFVFWLGIVAFGTWFVTMTYCLLSAAAARR